MRVLGLYLLSIIAFVMTYITLKTMLTFLVA